MRRVARTEAAERDFEEIMEWLYDHSPTVAERVPSALDARLRLLASQPRTGRARDELRSAVVEYYAVFFTVTDDEILVRRIVHTSRGVGAVSFDEN